MAFRMATRSRLKQSRVGIAYRLFHRISKPHLGNAPVPEESASFFPVMTSVPACHNKISYSGEQGKFIMSTGDG